MYYNYIKTKKFHLITTEGKIVIDGSWDGKRIEAPISFFIEEGVIVKIEGGDLAEEIDKQIELIGSNLRSSKAALIGTFAEFGFGMNSRAKITGNALEDLVHRGGVYFGFGNNMALGGSVSVPLHLRGVMLDASVTLEDIDLVKNGKVIAKVR